MSSQVGGHAVAATPEGRRLTEQHRQAQLANQRSFLAEFLATWGLLRLDDLDASTPNWLRVIMRLIELFRQDSARLALNYAKRYRELEIPGSPIEPPEIDFYSGDGPHVVLDLPGGATRVPRRSPGRPPARIPLRTTGDRGLVINWRERDPRVEASLRITGPFEVKRRIKLGESPERARRNAAAQAGGAGLRHVADGGRDTVLTVVQNDQAALGWIRVTAADPCAFCSLLASRGITWNRYNQHSFVASDIRFAGDLRNDDAVTAKVHDHCRCTLCPVWVENDPALDAGKQWRRLWNEHISGRYTGKDAINAWRRLYERPELFKQKTDQARPRRRVA
jgi:hypothetical protein